MLSSVRTICITENQTRTINDLSSKINHNGETTLELDSHADTCVLGQDALIILDYDRPVSVYGYDSALGAKTYKTVSGVVAYDDPISGEVYHLVINQAIHIPHLDHHLLCPMQCRVNDVTISELPKFLATAPTDQTHALTIKDPDNLTQTITLRLALRGVISLLTVRKPTIDDWNSGEIRRLALTSETLTWDPSTTSYEEQEDAMTDYSGTVLDRTNLRGQLNTLVISSLVSFHADAANITDDSNFHRVLTNHVMISSIESDLSGHLRTRAHAPMDSRTLAARWMISPEQAQLTLSRTTQRGVRTCLNPTVARRYPTNDRMLRYRRLPHPVFTDTMFAGTASVGGMKCAQVYTTSFGWCRAHPMKRKGEAPETLSLLFHRDGVPPSMIADNSKEQILGDFRRKLREADCHLKQTEPYSPWM